MSGKTAQQTIDQKSEVLKELAMKIWENPEIGYEEEKACRWTAEFLENEGFTVETKCAGLPTAIRASWGEGKPVIGFLGEYDALPGMSQKVSAEKSPIKEGGPGHGCGHNLLGVAHLGAAIGLKKEMEEKNLKGTIVFYGCPAEETLTGKTFMARNGAFRDLDIAFAWHPAAANAITLGTMTALNSVKFSFKGITAHAGGDPHNGRSALDAAELMNVGANFLREHVTADVRIHYVFTDGGSVPNVVPDKAAVWYYIRALSREAVVDTYERLIKIAEGAALMTETEVAVELLGGCYNTSQSKVLVDTVYETMKEVPVPTWSEEDKAFAAALNKSSANYDKMLASHSITKDIQLDSSIAPISYKDNYGSSDVGDVQHIVPGVLFMTASSNIGAAFHSWHNTACAGHSIGIKGMLHGAKIMAVSALKAIENPTIIEKAKAEFNETMDGRAYICPIPDEVPIP